MPLQSGQVYTTGNFLANRNDTTKSLQAYRQAGRIRPNRLKFNSSTSHGRPQKYFVRKTSKTGKLSVNLSNATSFGNPLATNVSMIRPRPVLL